MVEFLQRDLTDLWQAVCVWRWVCEGEDVLWEWQLHHYNINYLSEYSLSIFDTMFQILSSPHSQFLSSIPPSDKEGLEKKKLWKFSKRVDGWVQKLDFVLQRFFITRNVLKWRKNIIFFSETFPCSISPPQYWMYLVPQFSANWSIKYLHLLCSINRYWISPGRRMSFWWVLDTKLLLSRLFAGKQVQQMKIFMKIDKERFHGRNFFKKNI